MAKIKEKVLSFDEDLITPFERTRFAEAQQIMKRTNRHYRPIPKFRGGCKDC